MYIFILSPWKVAIRLRKAVNNGHRGGGGAEISELVGYETPCLGPGTKALLEVPLASTSASAPIKLTDFEAMASVLR
jgi:hypothetical protein